MPFYQERINHEIKNNIMASESRLARRAMARAEAKGKKLKPISGVTYHKRNGLTVCKRFVIGEPVEIVTDAPWEGLFG